MLRLRPLVLLPASLLIASVALAAPAAAPAPAAGAPASADFDKKFLTGTPKTGPKGIQYVDVVPGSGAAIAAGQVAKFTFSGWLTDGKQVMAMGTTGEPACFPLGQSSRIPFISDVLAGMKAGNKRRFRVPPEAAFGKEGSGPRIPPDSTLLVEIELQGIEAGTTKPSLEGVTMKSSPSGLKWADLKVGTGEEIKAGSDALMHYAGFLEDGKKFDCSWDKCRPYQVKGVGKAAVIQGWNEGLLGMKQGGRRVLVIPANLGYGPEGNLPQIPPNATLTFLVEALEVSPPPKPVDPMNFPDLKALKLTTNPSGLQWADVKVGTGPEVVKGSTAAMHYTGWLENGNKFDSSLDRNQTFDVANVGSAGVIAGWNEGLQGMKEGGRRVLVIPAKLGYGDRGFPPVIPSNATLVFMIDAVRVRR